MSDYYPNDYPNGTNVGTGMAPCRKNCPCADCTIDRLQARIAELESPVLPDEVEKGIDLAESLCSPMLADLIERLARENKDFKNKWVWAEIAHKRNVEMEARIAELESPWIPVSERLPEASGPYRSKAVLIYCPSNECIFAACYSFENSGWEYFAVDSVEVNHNVTHWMHLPEHPQESKK